MRIALLAPLVSPIAPPFLGGAQAVLYDLARGLATRGHDVTLFGADGSAVPGVRTPRLDLDPARFTPARFTPPSSSGAPSAQSPAGATSESDEEEEDEDDVQQPDEEIFQQTYAFMHIFRLIATHAREYDLVHAHAFDWPAFAYGTTQPLPMVHTLHLPPVDARIAHLLARLAPPEGGGRAHLVTVSRALAAAWSATCRIDAVLYNGVDVERIPFGARADADRYVLFAGRMAPEKGVEDALAIARRAGLRLVVAGGVYDQEYFATRVEPRIAASPARAAYIGVVPREELWRLMAGATAVLVPSRWEEPFNLVAAEAQAAGTPVIAYARGGLTEVIADGETGALVPPCDIDAAAAALRRVGDYDRAACREWISSHFSLAAMLDAHERYYRTLR